MLTRLTIGRFKSLKSVDLTLGALNFFIGANASGKSNLFDAIRVLQGIGYGFTVNEIFNGRPRTTSSAEWDGIRGGSESALYRPHEKRRGPKKTADKLVHLSTTYQLPSGEYRYSVHFDPAVGVICAESLFINDDKIFDAPIIQSGQPNLTVSFKRNIGKGAPNMAKFERHRPVLHQITANGYLTEDKRIQVETFVKVLGDVEKLDQTPSVLHQYSARQNAERLGERGEDFAALVGTIGKDKTERQVYVSWLKELTPRELDDIEILKGAVNDQLFALREGANVFPAPVLSDGTLRFAALTAALFQAVQPSMLLFEEIDNGIHPTRLRLLLELLRSQTKKLGAPQLFATTHSPILLAWLASADYKTTFFCRRAQDGASEIHAVSEIPQFHEILQKTPFSDLFAEGWLEGPL